MTVVAEVAFLAATVAATTSWIAPLSAWGSFDHARCNAILLAHGAIFEGVSVKRQFPDFGVVSGMIVAAIAIVFGLLGTLAFLGTPKNEAPRICVRRRSDAVFPPGRRCDGGKRTGLGDRLCRNLSSHPLPILIATIDYSRRGAGRAPIGVSSAASLETLDRASAGTARGSRTRSRGWVGMYPPAASPPIDLGRERFWL